MTDPASDSALRGAAGLPPWPFCSARAARVPGVRRRREHRPRGARTTAPPGAPTPVRAPASRPSRTSTPSPSSSTTPSLPAEAEPRGPRPRDGAPYDDPGDRRQQRAWQATTVHEAKQAAQGLPRRGPDDLYVGIVTFASDVDVAQEPTLDREASTEVDRRAHALHTRRSSTTASSAPSRAARQGGSAASSCSPTAGTPPRPRSTGVTSAIELAQVKVDVVALAQSDRRTRPLLEQLADAGGGP